MQAAPGLAPAQGRAVTVGPVAVDDGDDPVAALRGAFIALLEALTAAGALPPHIHTMTWKAVRPALWMENRFAADRAYRQVFGGNYPAVAFTEAETLGGGAAAELSMTAVVPPPPGPGPVYGGMDAMTLNGQYSARLAVPDHLDIFSDWTRRSGAVRAGVGCQDLPYGPSVDETLYLFHPGGGPAPLLIFLHGGYWQALDRDDHCFLAPGPLANGCAVAIVNYGLCPVVTMDGIVAQARRAAGFLWRQAADLDLMRGRFVLGGHSAGAQLAAMLLAPWPAGADEARQPSFAGAALISGVYDVEPLRHTGLNRVLRLDAGAARRNSPLWMKPRQPVPLVMAVGGDESTEFHRQSGSFGETWAAHGCPVQPLTLAGHNHFSALEQMADAASPLFQAVDGLLRS